jgi:outer membrane protein OmpA-like peptidoglycan-associated protein
MAEDNKNDTIFGFDKKDLINKAVPILETILKAYKSLTEKALEKLEEFKAQEKVEDKKFKVVKNKEDK